MDFTAALPNEQMLAQAPFAPLPKGGRRVIGVDERHTIMDALEDEGCATEVGMVLGLLECHVQRRPADSLVSPAARGTCLLQLLAPFEHGLPPPLLRLST